MWMVKVCLCMPYESYLNVHVAICFSFNDAYVSIVALKWLKSGAKMGLFPSILIVAMRQASLAGKMGTIRRRRRRRAWSEGAIRCKGRGLNTQ